MLKKIALFSIFLFLFINPVHGYYDVANSDFLSNISNWTYSGGVASYAGWLGHTAVGSAKITQTGGATTVMRQKVINVTGLVNGSSYEYSAWLYVNSSNSQVVAGQPIGGFMSVGSGTANWAAYTAYGLVGDVVINDTWTNVTMNFTYNNGTDLWLMLYANGSNASGGGFVFWDDVLVYDYTPSNASESSNVTCGYVNSAINLTGNLNTTGECLLINSSNIRIDCNGYNITGNGTGVGINISGFTHVILDNCSVSSFEIDIFLRKSNNILFSNSSSVSFTSYNCTNISVNLPYYNCSYGFKGARILTPVDWPYCRFNLSIAHGRNCYVESYEAKAFPKTVIIAFGAGGLAILLEIWRRRRLRK